MTAPASYTGLGPAIGSTTLVAGTLDIATTLTKYYLTTGNSLLVLYYIASGMWGTGAFKREIGIAAAGLLFHYTLALLYGAIVWLVMNDLVVPLSHTPTIPFRVGPAAIELFILMGCIGVPVALGARRYHHLHAPLLRPQA